MPLSLQVSRPPLFFFDFQRYSVKKTACGVRLNAATKNSFNKMKNVSCVTAELI